MRKLVEHFKRFIYSDSGVNFPVKIIPKSFKFLTSSSEQNESLRSRLNSSDGDLSKDDHVANLENSIKNYEMRQNHSKIALQNLEKSISTYHEKLEILEGVVTGNFYQIFED